MSTTDGKSSAALERDVERTRARLSGKLEELRDRMSPQQVVEDLMDYARGGEFMTAIGKTMRDNPMPLLLIGAGIGWMMMTSGGTGTERRFVSGHGEGRLRGNGHLGRERYRTQGMHPYGVGEQGIDHGLDYERRGNGSGHGLGHRASEAAAGVRDTAVAAASSIGEAATSAWHGVTHAASDAVSAVGDAASSARHEASHYASSFGDRSSERMGAMRRKSGGAFEAVQDQPLVLAAIGLAVGAAIGAAIPATRTEDEMFGESSDQLKREAGNLGQEGYEKARSVATRAFGEAEDEARRQGLTGDGNEPNRSGQSSWRAAGDQRSGDRSPRRTTGNGRHTDEDIAREGMRHEAEQNVGPIRS